jgi:methionyl-tRNA formyltransferase
MSDTVTLFLMTKKGYGVLKAVTASFPEIIEGVVSSRDANIEEDYYEEIEEFCKSNGVRFSDRHTAGAIKSRYAIAVSWRWLIDPYSTTLIVFHDSLLPKYRGFAPLVSALINGDKSIGVTALFAVEEYDRGDIIAQSATTVTYPIKIQEAIDLITDNYRELALQITGQIAEGKILCGVKQDESQATYSLWRDEDDYTIDWGELAERIKRFIDAVGHPYKGSLTTVGGKEARILHAETLDDVHVENRTPGKVIFVKDNEPVVVCGKGLLRIVDIVDAQTNESLLPFCKFRLRFT